ncbi:ABC transporter substrate-binding protein [Demequina sediminicola]|uniref:ABC transporter substrate-binding protein n=1 Tax=Demequina sediminicola TaxID=1095026 RepID=UPI0007847B55|nr:ABC transporter substrate-binding protein [Demequina sediminicola]
MSIRTLSRVGVAAVAVSALALAGCSSSDEAETSATPESSSSTEATAAAGAELETVTEGKFTIATGEPAYEPWMVDNEPTNGEGFEAAVAYAVAEELGYSPEDVEWVRTSFETAIAPGVKDWDVNIQQFSITEERKNAVDFSSPYYTTSQAIVADADSDLATATSVADLAGYRIGVPSGTTSYAVAAESIGEDDLAVFNSAEDTVAAFNSGQIDGFITDLPSAFYLSAVELDNGAIVGQFPAEDEGDGDQFAFVLPKDSPNTATVTAAVDVLNENGTLAALETEWLSDAVDVPVLD